MSDSGQGKSGPQVSEEPGETYLTLDPLRADGPDAITPAGIAEISKTRLRRLEITSDNAFHEIRIHEADDLFLCADADGPMFSPIPSTGTITAATIEIAFTDSPEPRQVTIRLPDTILLERPADATIIFRWLEKHRFRLQRKLTTLLLFLSLSLMAAAASPLLDNTPDDDDDDDDDHHQHLAFSI